MAEQWNLKRLRRADVLVVASVCLLVVLLVPVLLIMPRERSIRMQCRANLSQIGKTMFTYAADYEGVLPRAGGPITTWGPTANWMGSDRHTAFGLSPDGSGGRATISASLFLLVKYCQVPTSQFLCPGDRGTTEFKLADLRAIPRTFKLSDAWDFGPLSESFKHCSFAYHIPYGQYALMTSRDPNLAVAADRNPFIRSPGAEAACVASFKPDLDAYRGVPDQARAGNAVTHRLDGQNVLFLDGRVTFEKRAYCASGNSLYGRDNIYLVSSVSAAGSPLGCVPSLAAQPSNESDSVLVHDPDRWP